VIPNPAADLRNFSHRMATILAQETLAFAFGEQKFSDVELVFMQVQLQQRQLKKRKRQPPKTKRGKAAAKKRREEGKSL